MPTKERTNKINNSPAEKEEKYVSPPPQRSASPPVNRRGICTLGNGKSDGDGLRSGIGGNVETEVWSKLEAISEIDEENVAATVGGQTSEDSRVAAEQQSQSTRKTSQGRGAVSETSLSASPVRSPPSKTSSGLSSDYCLKDDIEEMEAREYTKGSDTDALPKIEYCSKRIGFKEAASEKLKEELQEQLILNEAESRDDNTALTGKMKNVDAVDDAEATVLTVVPKEEKIAAATKSKVIAPTEPVNNKDDSSSTGMINESFSSPNNQLQLMNGGSCSKESNAGEAGQQLKQQGTTSFTGSGGGGAGAGISVSVDKEGETASVHDDMDMANTPSEQQEGLVKGKKTCYSGLEMSPTAPSSPSYLQMTAESNLDMDCDVVEKVTARSNERDYISDDLLPPIKKLRKTDSPPEESGDGSSDLHLRIATASELEKVSDEGTNGPAQKPNTSGETESTSNCSTNKEVIADSVVSRSSSIPDAKTAQQETSSVSMEEHADNCSSSLDGIISNRQRSGGVIVDINSQTSVKEQPRAKEGIKKGSRKGTEESTRDLATNVSEDHAEGEEMGTRDICKSENGPLVLSPSIGASSDIPAQRREDVSTMNDFPDGNGRSAGVTAHHHSLDHSYFLMTRCMN